MEAVQALSKAFDPIVPTIAGFPVKAKLYMASCSGLDAWSKKLGFPTRHIGLAANPLDRIHAMRACSYGGVGLMNSAEGVFVQEAGWDDWHLVPFEPSDEDTEFVLEEGMLQVMSPVLPLDLLSRRLLLLLAPLEASRCSHLPTALAAQAFKSKRHGVLSPRYTSVSSCQYGVARDLYYYNSRMTDLLSAAIYAALNAHTDGHAASSIGVALDLAVNGGEYIGACDLFA